MGSGLVGFAYERHMGGNLLLSLRIGRNIPSGPTRPKVKVSEFRKQKDMVIQASGPLCPHGLIKGSRVTSLE